jgi:multiple sugar transport system permease protein
MQVTQASRRRWKSGGLFLFALLVSVPSLFVFYWMITISLKSVVDNTSYPPIFIFKPTLEAYHKVLVGTPFLKYTWNSMVVSVASVIAGLMIGLPCAYAIDRWRLRGMAMGIILTRMIPGITFLVPWYLLFRSMKLLDTYTVLILGQMVIAVPLVVWFMLGFFEEIPIEIKEAARIDGCSEYGVLGRILVPLTKPGIAATSIISFIYAWNNFLFPVILAGRETKTLPAAVFSLLSYDEVNWGALAAEATLVTLPVLLLGLFAQRHIVKGMISGGVKG